MRMQNRLTAILPNFFGLLAASLVCVGLYRLMSYTVAQRTGEMAIWMALEAEGGPVQWMMVRESLSTVAPTAVLLAAVAGSLPAQRATRIEPITALRHD